MNDIDKFLQVVFPELPDDENRVFATSKYETLTYAEFSKKMGPRKTVEAYYNASTFTLDDDGALFRRAAFFAGLYVCVFDDIGEGAGSKCPRDKFPVELWENCTYRVETSPGNFQVGFALEDPVRHPQQAKELIGLLYGAGPWDGGGAQATKLIRLPGGYNKKKNKDTKEWVYPGADGKPWAVRLDTLSDTLWTPQELLDGVDAGVGWDEVVQGIGSQRDPRNTRGAAAFMPVQMDEQGVVDEVAEWLNATGWVLHEGYPFLTIKCPWGHEHSDGVIAGSYSPLGWGDTEHYRNTRGFHCFHDHCKDNKTAEFLVEIARLGGPTGVGVYDPVGGAIGRYALDVIRQDWVDMKSETMHRIPHPGFTLMNKDRVFIPQATGVSKAVPKITLLQENPLLLKFHGGVYDPIGDRIVERDYGKVINDCKLPFYGSGDYDQAHVDRFRGFIQYLLPHNEGGDAEYLIRHIARKVQVPTHRGPGLFMYTNGVEGVGRGTLAKILTGLWRDANVGQPSMGAFAKALGGDFNTQVRKLWLIIGEAREGNLSQRKQDERYENFKQFCDPAPVLVTWNIKNKPEWSEYSYASVIVCSNHIDGLTTSLDTRRIKRLENCDIPWSTEEFVAIHAWIDAGEWQESVWRYLAQYDLGDWTGTENLNDERTEEEENEALSAISSPMVKGLRLAAEYINAVAEGVCLSSNVVDAVLDCQVELGIHEEDSARRWGTTHFNGLAPRTKKNTKVPELGPRRLRFIANGPGAPLRKEYEGGRVGGLRITALYARGADRAAMVAYIKRRLAELE